MENPCPLHHQASQVRNFAVMLDSSLCLTPYLHMLPWSPSPMDSNPGKSFLLTFLPSSPCPLTWLNSALMCFYLRVSILSFLPPLNLHWHHWDHTSSPLPFRMCACPSWPKRQFYLLSLVWETLLSWTPTSLPDPFPPPHCVPGVLQQSIPLPTSFLCSLLTLLPLCWLKI